MITSTQINAVMLITHCLTGNKKMLSHTITLKSKGHKQNKSVKLTNPSLVKYDQPNMPGMIKYNYETTYCTLGGRYDKQKEMYK